MNILKRIKNLWKLSEYNPKYDVETINGTVTIEDKLTIEKNIKQKKKLAKIVETKKVELFPNQEENGNSN